MESFFSAADGDIGCDMKKPLAGDDSKVYALETVKIVFAKVIPDPFK